MIFHIPPHESRTNASFRSSVTFGLMIAGIAGCGAAGLDLPSSDATPGVASSSKSAGSERDADLTSADLSQPRRSDADLAATVDRAREVVALFQQLRIPPQAPAWIRMHTLLMFPLVPASGPTESASQRRALIEGLLLASNREQVPFSLRDREPIPRTGGALFEREHHPDQILSYLALIGVPLEQPMRVEDNAFSVGDMLRVSQREVRQKQELSWTVSAYAHYGKPGQVWENKYGERLSLAILAKALSEKAETACGGAHRLTAIARVVSLPANGQDVELSRLQTSLRRLLDDETQRLRSGQFPDGVFGAPDSLLNQPDVPVEAIDIQFTGHSLEWLTLAHGSDVLKSEWVVRAVDALVDRLQQAYDVCQDGLLQREIRAKTDVALQFRVGSAAHAVGALARWLHRLQAVPPEIVVRP